MDKIELKIDLAKWPEAHEYENITFYRSAGELKVFKTKYNPFGRGPEEDIPQEWVTKMKRLIPKYFSRTRNSFALEADNMGGWAANFLNDWIEEDLDGKLDELVINFAMENGLTQPVVTKELTEYIKDGEPPVKLSYDEACLLRDMVALHGRHFAIIQTVGYYADQSEEESLGARKMIEEAEQSNIQLMIKLDKLILQAE